METGGEHQSCYAMLCFRTLPINVLRKYLPADLHLRHPWNSLNITNPLFRNRKNFNDTNNRIIDYKPAYGIGEVWRNDDASKGDKLYVELVCSGCSDSSDLLVDRTLRYEIATGAYLACIRRNHYCCPHKLSLFIPLDQSRPWNAINNVIEKNNFRADKQRPPIVTRCFQLFRLRMREIRAWIESKGFRVGSESVKKKTVLIVRAINIWSYLIGPRDLTSQQLLRETLRGGLKPDQLVQRRDVFAQMSTLSIWQWLASKAPCA